LISKKSKINDQIPSLAYSFHPLLANCFDRIDFIPRSLADITTFPTFGVCSQSFISSNSKPNHASFYAFGQKLKTQLIKKNRKSVRFLIPFFDVN
jgi:hypothetical protein